MYKTKDGEYKCYKRIRTGESGNKYTELLFLYHEIPLSLVNQTDKENPVYNYIVNEHGIPVEDRDVEVNMLGESFTARIIRPHIGWFNGQRSYGVELARLMTEYFGIRIWKEEDWTDPNKFGHSKKAYILATRYEYYYDLKEIKPEENNIKTINGNRNCPLENNWLDSYNRSCTKVCKTCPLSKITKNEDNKTVTICRCPKLNWRK